MNWIKSQLCKFFNMCCDSKININVIRNIEYSKGLVKKSKKDIEYSYCSLLMDMYEKKHDNRINRDYILLVHGGHFKEGSKSNDNLIKLIHRFVDSGYVCFSMDYRLEGSNPPGPGISILRAMHAAIVDVKTAIRFLQFNSNKFNINKNTIILGESAGAIAAISAVVSEKNEYLKDVDDDEFPIQNENMLNDIKPPVAIISLWGGATLSLSKFDSDDPPIYVAHGTNDMTIGASYLESIAMINVCKSKGIPFEFHKLDGYEHGAWDAKIDNLSLADSIINFLKSI